MKDLAVAIELFCGCGGMSTGFLDAGMKVSAGFDIDRRAVQAYRYNHEYRGSRGFEVDAVGLSGAEILRLAEVDYVDVLLAGPPCQPFSIVGKRRGREDNRANLIAEFVRLVRELRPKAFVFENVPNLTTIAEGSIFNELCRTLRHLGYGLEVGVVAAADYGVPQTRKRLLMIGVSGREAIGLPPVTHGAPLMSTNLPRHLTVDDAIGDLPDAGEYGEYGIHNHEPTLHSPDMVKRLSALRVGRTGKEFVPRSACIPIGHPTRSELEPEISLRFDQSIIGIRAWSRSGSLLVFRGSRTISCGPIGFRGSSNIVRSAMRCRRRWRLPLLAISHLN